MQNKLMLGLWRYMIGVPPFLWQRQIEKGKRDFADHLAFMTPAHRAVHYFTVRELVYAGRPLSPEYIADALALPVDRVGEILNDLETHMTFLFRNPQGQVHWAYPVTTDTTPHHLTFHAGEELYAA